MPPLESMLFCFRPGRRAGRAAARSTALMVALTGAAALPAAAVAETGGAEAGVAVAPAPAAAAATRTVAPRAVAPRRTIVAAVQRRLHLEADGVRGPLTRAALRRFQRRHHLPVDGRLRPAALAALGITATAAQAPTAEAAGVLAAIARCESGGDPAKVSADGAYRGKYQFLTDTWQAIGGEGDPAAASEAEQDRRAASLYAEQGTKPWPVCGEQALAG